MTTTAYGAGIRRRALMPARRLPDEMPERFRQNLANADRILAEPFTGITTSGAALAGLFRLEATGFSTAPVKEAAEGFLAALSPEQRRNACFPLESDAWQRWNNTHPYQMRHGVLMEELSEHQRQAGLELLRASLSARGFQTSRDIMRLNYTIGEISGSWEEYGEWVYWLSIFGTPSDSQPWGWQIDGHHLILNCFVLGDQLVLTPAFMGSEPVHAESGKFAGTRVLDLEEQRGLELAQSLSPSQLELAGRTQAPVEGAGPFDGRLKGGALRDNLVLPYEGVASTALTPGQRELLLGLVETYVGHMRPGHAEARMAEVRRHLDDTHLLWLGDTGADSVFYYRVHSPVILIEFDHQRGVAFDNDEPSRNHIHTVVRTPNGNDYGKDLLRQHYQRHHWPS
jgi:hypothetical protein